MSDWCPENDGAYRMELASIHKDKTAERITALEAENERLRAELIACRGAFTLSEKEEHG